MKKVYKIKSKIENIRKVEKIIDELCNELNVNSEMYGNILIATIEATNNAILHGNKLNEEKEVKIEIEKSRDSLKIAIEDEGEGFDYRNVPDPTAPENIEKITGRGIFLMEKLSDKLEFKKGGSRVEIYFNLKKVEN